MHGRRETRLAGEEEARRTGPDDEDRDVLDVVIVDGDGDVFVAGRRGRRRRRRGRIFCAGGAWLVSLSYM